jgi:hypothetical protein
VTIAWHKVQRNNGPLALLIPKSDFFRRVFLRNQQGAECAYLNNFIQKGRNQKVTTRPSFTSRPKSGLQSTRHQTRAKTYNAKRASTTHLRHYNQTTSLPTLSRPKSHPHPSWLRTLGCRPQPKRGGSPRGKRNHTPKRGLRAGKARRPPYC